MAIEGWLANGGLSGVLAFLSYDENKREAALRFLLGMRDDRICTTLLTLNPARVQAVDSTGIGLLISPHNSLKKAGAN